MQSSADGQPNVVIIAAVLAAVHAARTDTHLPSCLRLLHGTGVQCRA